MFDIWKSPITLYNYDEAYFVYIDLFPKRSLTTSIWGKLCSIPTNGMIYQ